MADISLEAVAGKLNRVGYEAFFKALRQAKGAGNRNVELAHWLVHILQSERTDIGLTADHFKIDPGKLMTDVTAVVNGFRKNETEMPAVSNTVMDLLDRGWHYATLFFGETQIRTGHILVGALQSRESARAPFHQCLAGIRQDLGRSCSPPNTARSGRARRRRTCARWTDRGWWPPVRRARARRRRKAPPRSTASPQDLTAKAKSGEMDPILGRDDEIRQIIDVLMRRRQNNPILTGEAGVGKTAVVEGFAQTHRRRRRAAAAARRQAVRARRRADAGGRVDEGRVRAAAALGDRRGAAVADPDHPVHRRSPYADRRRRIAPAPAMPPTCSSRRWRAARCAPSRPPPGRNTANTSRRIRR